MSVVRRGVTWLGILSALVGVTLPLAAAPATAAGETVRVTAPGGLVAGGSPGSVTVRVSMRRGECVSVRTRVGLQVPGLTPDVVRMQVAVDGAWQPVSVTLGGDGFVVSADTVPNRPELCARRSVASRYRVFLLAGAPPGRVTVLGEAYTAEGVLLGQDVETARMRGQTATVALPTQPATPSPTPEVTEAVDTEETVEPTEAATADVETRAATAAVDSGGGFGIGTMVMLVGLLMVGIGIALLVALVRRGRAERAGTPPRAAGTASPPVDALPTAPIQRRAGLYGRAARGVPGNRPVDPTVGRAGQPSGGRPSGPGPAATPPVGGPTGIDRTLALPTTDSARPRPSGSVPPRTAGTAPSAVPPGPGPIRRMPTDQEPTRRLSVDQELTRPITADQEPTRPIAAGREPTRWMSVDQELTRPIAADQEPTRPIAAGREPTRRVSADQEPTRPITTGDEPAAGGTETVVIPPPTPPRQP
jgi:hypothetical protein